MSGFSEDWLSLREPLDAASRDGELVDTLLSALPDRPVMVTDLAAGTGANFRYLSPRLGGRQHWRLIDHDAALLDAVPARLTTWASSLGAVTEESEDALLVRGPAFDCRIERVHGDLARSIEALHIPRRSLVTASALLDLVSAPWLAALADRCRRAEASVLFALTYDGQVEFHPRDRNDATVTELVNRHQQTDKGFGPALGPVAAERAAELFARHGYLVERAHSDWRMDDRHTALRDALLADWVSAASEVSPDLKTTMEAWAERRSGQSGTRIRVGHVDLLARLAR